MSELERALKLVIWAAKCHVQHQMTGMPLSRFSRLPHTPQEVERAIAVIRKETLR